MEIVKLASDIENQDFTYGMFAYDGTREDMEDDMGWCGYKSFDSVYEDFSHLIKHWDHVELFKERQRPDGTWEMLEMIKTGGRKEN